MKTTQKWSKMLTLGMSAMVLISGLVLTGCISTNKATSKAPNFERKPIGLADGRQFSVLGTVLLEKKWFGVLGFSIMAGPIASDVYVYQSGGVTYAELLAEARKKYPDADAVVDINVDYTGSTYAIFYAQRKNIVSGVAIKYAKEAAPGTPSLNVNLR